MKHLLFQTCWWGFSLIALNAVGLAQDSRDDDIFGGSSSGPVPSQPLAAPSADKRRETALEDRLQVGGRLEASATMYETEGTPPAKGAFNQLKRADIYFDARPEAGGDQVRGFLRMRWTDQSPSLSTGNKESGPKSDVDELWIKATAAKSVFFTVGRQHLKWGSGRLWNPTDFTAATSRDPFALFDSRLGQDLIKVHVPLEKGGHNLYFVLDGSQVSRTDDIRLLLRAEASVGESSEVALSLKKSREGPDQVGLDWSGALGAFDLYTEAALSKRVSKQFYEGRIDSSTLEVPVGQKKDQTLFKQGVFGVQYGLKYLDDDTLTFVLESFTNEQGYSSRDLELYAMIRGQESPLTVARSYLGLLVQAPSPGPWNDLNVYFNGIKNLVDQTAVARLTATYSILKTVNLEGYVSRCVGDVGSLCFRVPQSFKQLAGDARLSDEDRALLQQLPTNRTLTTLGVGISMNI